jgi:hypothetical protein
VQSARSNQVTLETINSVAQGPQEALEHQNACARRGSSEFLGCLMKNRIISLFSGIQILLWFVFKQREHSASFSKQQDH